MNSDTPNSNTGVSEANFEATRSQFDQIRTQTQNYLNLSPEEKEELYDVSLKYIRQGQKKHPEDCSDLPDPPSFGAVGFAEKLTGLFRALVVPRPK